MKKIMLNEYKDLNDKDLHVVKIATPWCGYCKMMAGIVEPDLVKEASDTTFYYVDADENKLWEAPADEEFKVEVVPTYFLVKDGKIIDKKIAFIAKEIFKDWINKNK